MWSDFMMKIEESWKTWDRMLKYFWTSDLKAASRHHYSSTTQQLRTDSRALPLPDYAILGKWPALFVLWSINDQMGLVSIPSLQDCENSRTLVWSGRWVLWQAVLVSYCCVTNCTQSYQLEITNIHYLQFQEFRSILAVWSASGSLVNQGVGWACGHLKVSLGKNPLPSSLTWTFQRAALLTAM